MRSSLYTNRHCCVKGTCEPTGAFWTVAFVCDSLSQSCRRIAPSSRVSTQQASYAASTASKPKKASVNSKTDDDSRKASHAGESLVAVWMAPELITGAPKRATPESDVFSFSIIVHEITFQKGPFGFMEQVRMPLVLPMQLAPRAIQTGGRQDFRFLVELGVEDRWRHQHPGHDGHHHVSGETRWRQPGPTGCPAKGLHHRRVAYSAVFGELADSTWLVVGWLSGARFQQNKRLNVLIDTMRRCWHAEAASAARCSSCWTGWTRRCPARTPTPWWMWRSASRPRRATSPTTCGAWTRPTSWCCAWCTSWGGSCRRHVLRPAHGRRAEGDRVRVCHSNDAHGGRCAAAEHRGHRVQPGRGHARQVDAGQHEQAARAAHGLRPRAAPVRRVAHDNKQQKFSSGNLVKCPPSQWKQVAYLIEICISLHIKPLFNCQEPNQWRFHNSYVLIFQYWMKEKPKMGYLALSYM